MINFFAQQAHYLKREHTKLLTDRITAIQEKNSMLKLERYVTTGTRDICFYIISENP